MKVSLKVLKLYSRHDFVTETDTYKIQRDVTKKIHIQELLFLHSASRPMLINICTKFHEDILNGFKDIERTCFCHRNCYITPGNVLRGNQMVMQRKTLR